MTRIWSGTVAVLTMAGVMAAVGCNERAAPGSAQGAKTAAATTAPARPVPSAATARVYSKPSDAVLRKQLTNMQYDVTQKEGTEPPYQNEYWNNHEEGLYVDAVSGEPLFSSRDKFESGTGWPSFTRPVDAARVISKTDDSLGVSRTEVRSRDANSHLGHVFDDGPAPTGLRYCINSAALRFVPASKLEAEGYVGY